jgi:hypothetical protein
MPTNNETQEQPEQPPLSEDVRDLLTRFAEELGSIYATYQTRQDSVYWDEFALYVARHLSGCLHSKSGETEVWWSAFENARRRARRKLRLQLIMEQEKDEQGEDANEACNG